MSDLRLVVGLGNPGSRYRATRHNVGFAVLDRLAAEYGLRFGSRRFRALLAQGEVHDQRVVLAKPQTYMNLSGDAVAPLVRWHKLPLDGLLVVHDDLDLPLGRLRLRSGGSAAGHLGMTSIIAALGGSDFPRLRVGIGRPPVEMDAAAYVLQPFSAEEQPIIGEALDRARQAAECWLTEGLTAAMNQFNA